MALLSPYIYLHVRSLKDSWLRPHVTLLTVTVLLIWAADHYGRASREHWKYPLVRRLVINETPAYASDASERRVKSTGETTSTGRVN